MTNFFTAIAILISTSICVFAQSLPAEMQLSPDGRMINTGGQTPTGLYDPSIIRTIDLTFSQANYWSQMQSNYANKIDIPADMTVDGVTYPNVGVRFKGQTSYFAAQNTDKKSFNISLDYSDPDLNLMGYQTLNLNNCFQDESYLREFIYLHQIRKHIPAAKAAFVHLNINGQSWGIYPSIQQLNGEFIREWFLSNDGSRWRADVETTTGGGPPNWGDGTAALNYLGTDTAQYQQYYTLKRSTTDNPWDDLVRTSDILENTPLANLEDSLRNVMDIDRTLWFLASEILFTDDDGYVYKGKMDYYLFWEAETGRMIPLEYDGNSVMDPNKFSWSPFHNETDANYPLLNRMLAVPSIRQRYLAHVRTMLEESIDTGMINPIIRQYGDMIDTEVFNDPKKIYTYNAFQAEKLALQQFFLSRYNYLSLNSEVDVVSPDISNVFYATNGQQWVKPLENEATTINASVSSSTGLSKVTMYYSNAIVGNFTAVEMFDDGNHDDGMAGDGVYGATIPGFVVGTNVRYYIEATANDAANTVSFMPKGAEHDVYYYNVAAGTSGNTSVVINEIMSSNTTTAQDDAGEYDDWIELYNKSASPVDLSGWYLTDKTDNLTKFQLPNGTTINGNDYLIIWADEDGSQGLLHANFKLSASGETLMLLDSFVLVVDSLSFGLQTTDLGYARVPNGTGNFIIQPPTWSFSNDNVSTNTIKKESNFTLFPNPTKGWLNVAIKGQIEYDFFEVFDAQGRKITEVAVQNNEFQVDASQWTNGLYLLKYGNEVKKLLVLK